MSGPVAGEEVDRLLELPTGPLRVRIRGEGSPLIWSHGVFFTTEVDDRSLLGSIVPRAPGFCVIRYDAPGHGRTPARPTPEAHRWDRMADELLALADALGLERFAVGGISMGAAVTLHAALRAPSRVAAALLFALPTAWETRPAEQRRYRELLAFGSPDALADHVQDDLDALFPAGDMPASLRAMVANMRRTPWQALERVIVGASESDMPARDHLASLQVPVLLRPWPHDSGHPLSTAEALAAVLPRVDLALLESFHDEPGIRAALDALRRACVDLPAARRHDFPVAMD